MTLLESAIRVLIIYGPDAYKAVVDLIHNANPTKEDYLKLLDFATQKTYDDYIKEAQSPAAPVPTP